MGNENMDIYCMKHDEIHTIKQHDAEKLIYQYQIRIAEAATSLALPHNELTQTEAILKTAFCVIEDGRKVIPQWRKHIDKMLGRRRYLLRLNTQTRHRIKQREQRSERTKAALTVTRSAPISGL